VECTAGREISESVVPPLQVGLPVDEQQNSILQRSSLAVFRLSFLYTFTPKVQYVHTAPLPACIAPKSRLQTLLTEEQHGAIGRI